MRSAPDFHDRGRYDREIVFRDSANALLVRYCVVRAPFRGARFPRHPPEPLPPPARGPARAACDALRFEIAPPVPMRSVLRPTLAFAALLMASCDAPAAEAGPRAAPAGAVSALRPAAATPRLSGRFVVAYTPVRDTVYARWQEEFRRGRFLEDVAGWLNGWIALPRDVRIGFEACGEPNAFYRPEDRTVALCYEMVDDLESAMTSPDGDDAEADQAVSDALLFTALHEVGHALVDVLEIPVIGREEDAVDQLAAVMLVDGTEEGSAAAVNGISGLAGGEEELDDSAFAGEHALGAQRFYNVLCLVYGQDPEAHQDWVDEGVLPGERAERCPEEYAQVSGGWDRLLEPYLRNQP
jgi:hypothetical protein